jgi:hypothetical protein
MTFNVMNSRMAYTAIQTFDPSSGEGWTKYIGWSQLDQLKEVISLDCMLCPSVIRELFDDDWNFKVYKEIFHDLFGNLDYLLDRIKGNSKCQILATIPEPTIDEVMAFNDHRFLFKGFDLIEDETRISALVNCGGFDLAFHKNDLSECGLITDIQKALRVQALLRANYPEEDHADCSMWALWRMETR